MIRADSGRVLLDGSGRVVMRWRWAGAALFVEFAPGRD